MSGIDNTQSYGRSQRLVIVAWLVACVVLFPVSLLVGSVDIPAADVVAALTGSDDVGREAWRVIVLESRLPAAVVALLCGAALSVAGLLMQTCFTNPLAGPSILGIATGAGLGVALVMLACGGAAVGAWGETAVIGGAFVGAMAVMLMLLALSAVVRSSIMLLIVGILIGYVTSSAISLLNFFATQEGVHSYVIWGLGSFTGVTPGRLPALAMMTVAALVVAMVFAKPLNAMLLGERYAASVGVNVARLRRALVLISGLLTAVVTAYCGPIGFIGLVVPHIARLTLRSSNHRFLLPCTALAGGAVGLLCLVVSVLPGQSGVLPINAITPIIGVPVILYVILNRRKIFYFN